MQSGIHMASHIGLRNPMYCTGVGKAILAFLPEAEKRLIVENTVYEMFTPHTLHTPQALLADLELIRNRGYAFDEEEHELGISCIAAPIKNKQGIAYAAISISAPTSRLEYEKKLLLAKKICVAAERISELLNGSRG